MFKRIENVERPSAQRTDRSTETKIKEADPVETKTEAKPVEKQTELTKEDIKQFRDKFKGVDGVDKIAALAEREDSKAKLGAKHQIEVAYQLDDRVASFEAPITPENLDENHIDITTKSNIAVECKAHSSPEDVRDWIGRDYQQAARRLLPIEKGAPPAGVVVVYPDGMLDSKARVETKGMETLSNGRIRFCEKREVNNVLDQMERGR